MAVPVLAGCYEDYVKDFDYSGGYIAYQYDLRTFVCGEGESFDISVALAGLLSNTADRYFNVSVDDDLVTGDLSGIYPYAKADPFTAYEVMSGSKNGFGLMAGGSNSYVAGEILAAGLTGLKPLPKEYYTLDVDNFAIRKGEFNAYKTIKATDRFFEDPLSTSPYYAIGYRINDAQVDTVLSDRSFSIVAVKYENKFYGQWYHGGSYVKDGRTIRYPFSIPQADEKVYTLTTVDRNTVVTDKIVQGAGSLRLTFNGDDITVSSDDVTLLPDSRPSYFNGAGLLQDRKLFLNYSYLDTDGKAVIVSDSLVFRSRVRDGVTEWQDEVKEHYK